MVGCQLTCEFWFNGDMGSAAPGQVEYSITDYIHLNAMTVFRCSAYLDCE